MHHQRISTNRSTGQKNRRPPAPDRTPDRIHCKLAASGCACALILFPSTFSLTLRKLTETQGNSIPHLQKASKVLNYPTRQRFHRQTFQHTPVKSVSPPSL